MKFLRMIIKHFLFFVSHIYFVFQKKIYLIKNKENSDQFINNNKSNELVNELNKNGYVVIKNFFDKDKIDNLYEYFYKQLNTNEEDFFAYLKKEKISLNKLKEQNINYREKVNGNLWINKK